jgi:hypothetical protein
MHLPDLKGVRSASENLKDVSIVTPLTLNEKIFKKLDHSKFVEHLIKLNQLILIIQKTKELFVLVPEIMHKGLPFLVTS